MNVEIHQALVSAFIAGDFGLPIAHENMHYTPDPEQAYFEIRVLQNDVTPYSLAGSDETDGVFRVILRSPQGTGAIAPKQKARETTDAMGIGRRLVYGGVTVTVVGQQQQPGVAEDGWHVLITDFAFKAFSKR